MSLYLEHRLGFLGRHEYRCPMCPEKGWMSGGGTWQHLRGGAHICGHEQATGMIHYARTGKDYWEAVCPT